MKSIAAGRPCRTDGECHTGHYCASSVCLRCYNCTQYYMRATDDCSRSITECGECLPGYILAQNKLEGCTSPKNSTLPYWPALLAAAVAVILFLIGFLARHILARKKTTDTVRASNSEFSFVSLIVKVQRVRIEFCMDAIGILAVAERKKRGIERKCGTGEFWCLAEEYTRLNPTHLESRSNGYQPAANAHTRENQDDTPLLVTTGASPPPYSTVLNEIRASSQPASAGAADRPPQNGSNPAQDNSQGLSIRYDDTNNVPELSSDDASRLETENGHPRRNHLWASNHPRIHKGHPKDTRISRENDIRQRARKYNNPIYDNNEMFTDNATAPTGQNEIPDWLQDEDTMESGWSPHASGTAAATPSATASADTTAPSSNASQVNGSETAGEPVACVRVTTRARTDDDGPPRTRRRLASDNNRVAEVGERTLVIRSPAGAASSPPASGDDLTPEDGARRPLYSYSVINIQPELSIIAKIK
ncbi:hypothetical protein EVAR_27737_1 [Eumeta japonica]|uniref:Uncharacterized protein n=1 Tax=Eumeta variegata TaxID=151549 RepID=A0A4C1VC20_EUMVA|nr:hypothetical protein EVAR_27737_1 [Eumeta japonica]